MRATLDSTPPPTEYDLTTGEVSRRLRCSRQAVDRLVTAGLLDRYQVPGCWPRYRRDQVEDLAARCRTRREA
jgi:hypothetical protein